MAARRVVPVYQLGNALSVPMILHEENRKRLCKKMKATNKIKNNAFILLQGGTDQYLGGSDSALTFRQESYFHWAFGVLEPDFYGLINIDSAKTILFMPQLDENYATFMGALETTNEVKQKYAVDEVYYKDEIPNVLDSLKPSEIHTLHGMNTDSHNYTMEASFAGIAKFQVVNSILHNEITDCRVIKTNQELEVLRYANKASSKAHRDIMRSVHPGMYEYQIESLFLHHCYFHGAMRNVAYTSIGATGCNCSVLHYGHAGAPNDKKIEDGDMCLFDMGGEYYCYSSDITCSFPVNGHFTKDQKMVYESVLAASRAVQNACKPGVSWVDMHLLAERVILTSLKEAGLLQGDVNEMMAARLGATFMPHGLGHFLGIDVHDVGGYIEDAIPRSELAGLCRLRTTRLLQENMVLTIEPGCYFIDFLLDSAINNPEKARFLVVNEINRFRNFGGVRIEDDVIITSSGIECMTEVPRTCEEIEQWMAGIDKMSFLKNQ